MNEYQIVFDGGSKGNPGPGFGSYAIFSDDDTVVRKRLELGEHVTNNEAEYQTLIGALQHLLDIVGDERKRTNVTILGDSQLVVNQVNGLWKIKKPELFALRNQVVELLNEFAKAEVRWHSRIHSLAILGH